MIDLAPATLTMATYAAGFRRFDGEIRFAQQQAEKAFGPWLNVTSAQTNLPDNMDPNAARIIFQAGGKQVAISQTGIQLSLTFDESKAMPLKERLDTVQKNIGEFHSCALMFKPEDEYQLSSLILQINRRAQAVDSYQDLSQLLIKQMGTTIVKDNVASVGFQLGYRHGELFANVNAAVYEKRTLDFKIAPGQAIVAHVDQSKVLERGIGMTIDVNSRPRFMGDPDAHIVNPTALFIEAVAFTSKQEEIIFGQG
jgi:hypothetical protein